MRRGYQYYDFILLPDTQDTFWSRIDRGNEDGCWTFKGWTSRDYPTFPVLVNGERRATRASRVVLAMVHGRMPSDKVACHRCDNPPCVRPTHLFIGSHSDNMADAVKKGRLGSKTGSARLTKASLYNEIAFHEALKRMLGLLGLPHDTNATTKDMLMAYEEHQHGILAELQVWWSSAEYTSRYPKATRLIKRSAT